MVHQKTIKSTGRPAPRRQFRIGLTLLGGFPLSVERPVIASTGSSEENLLFMPSRAGRLGENWRLPDERWGQPSVLGELLMGMGLGSLLPLVVGAQVV